MPSFEKLTKVQREITSEHLKNCPTFESRPWVNSPPIDQCRVAMISTAGLHMRDDRPFQFGKHDFYRIIPGDIQANNLVMSHGEPSFDRVGFQRDYNVIFPIDRLRELAKDGVIGSVADFHYSFGSPMSMADTEQAIREICTLLKKDNVSAVLFPSPVCPGCTRDCSIMAHFVEEEGIPTSCISAIRPYSEIVKPPRSLWVPFVLGRPLGVPNDPTFQKEVLIALLNLFEVEEHDGPVVLVDYPKDAPDVEDDTMVIACPVYFGDSEGEADSDLLQNAFLREFKSMRSWYDMAVKKRQRTTVGISGVDLDFLGEFIYLCAIGETPENPRSDIELASTLKLAVDDLRAYYSEGITAQPGQEEVSLRAFNDWFWNKTKAAKVLMILLDTVEKSSDEGFIKIVPFLVPTDIYTRHKGEIPHVGNTLSKQ